jgi:hypothetical protein
MRLSFMPRHIPEYFEEYAELYNRALAGEDVIEEIMDHFTDTFMAAGPQGVEAAKNGHSFRKMLEKGYKFYRDIGARKMSVNKVEVTDIDPAHAMAKVFFHADYEKADGTPVGIDFDVTYLLDLTAANPRIFAFVAGDEMQAYKDAGLVPDGVETPSQPQAEPARDRRTTH